RVSTGKQPPFVGGRHWKYIFPQSAKLNTPLRRSKMLAVGEQFPSYSLTATVSTDNSDKAFKTITNLDYPGKWKVYFFWPKDFTFVCPTEIAAFGKLNKEFLDRDTQILGGSIDSEFVHRAWRVHHEDLHNLPFPMQVFVVDAPGAVHKLGVGAAAE